MSKEPGLDRDAPQRVLERAMELDIKVKDELTAVTVSPIRELATFSSSQSSGAARECTCGGSPHWTISATG